MTQMMWKELAVRKPSERVGQLGNLLVELLGSKWDLVTPRSAERRWGIVRVQAPTKDPKNTLYGWLYANGPRIGGSGGTGDPSKQTFRLCPHIYNTERDVENAVDGMNRWRALYGA